MHHSLQQLCIRDHDSKDQVSMYFHDFIRLFSRRTGRNWGLVQVDSLLGDNIIQMQNEDQVGAILDKMEKSISPQEFSTGLEILYKLIHNIISNPFDPKFRNVKTTNNTIKTKVMNMTGVDNLLKQLGYILENGDTFVLKDEQIAQFLEGAPAVDYRRRLASAKLESEQAYKKELLVINEHRAQQRERYLKEKQTQRLKQQCKYDAAERKHMKVDTSKSNNLKFGTKETTFKDIGVDLCANKGG